MLACVLAIGLCLSVCAYVTLQFCLEKAAGNELDILHTGFPRLTVLCILRKLGYLQKYGYLLPEICPKLWT